jgi:hypothetical protein
VYCCYLNPTKKTPLEAPRARSHLARRCKCLTQRRRSRRLWQRSRRRFANAGFKRVRRSLNDLERHDRPPARPHRGLQDRGRCEPGGEVRGRASVAAFHPGGWPQYRRKRSTPGLSTLDQVPRWVIWMQPHKPTPLPCRPASTPRPESRASRLAADSGDSVVSTG